MKCYRRYFEFILLLLQLSCCGDISSIYNDMKSLKSHPINMNDSLFVTVSDNHSLNSKSVLTFVEYFDSAECSPCAISRMYLWDMFVDKHNEHNDHIRYKFIFYTPDSVGNSIDSSISNNPSISVYWDPCGSFGRNNPQIPDNPNMHSFLIDEDNNILLIGNPLTNSKIDKLFSKIISKYHYLE